jgi:hypothetical protein
MIALSNILTGMPVVSEEPALRLPRIVLNINESAGGAMVQAALQSMTKEAAHKFQELHGATSLEKLRLNCCPLNPSVREVATFFSHARVNHSCRPNAINMVDEDTMTLIASQDIKAGEEITISYFTCPSDLLLDRTDRKARIRQIYEGFNLLPWDCCCELCVAPETEAIESDANRQALRGIKERFMTAALAPQLLQDYQAMIDLGKVEGLGPYHAVGEDAIIKMQGQHSEGLASPANALNFQVGDRVVLFKLVAKPELNGKTGRVVTEFNKETGRIGVVIECEEGAATQPAIALKLTRIMKLGSS